jgi:hypothetical protein
MELVASNKLDIIEALTLEGAYFFFFNDCIYLLALNIDHIKIAVLSNSDDWQPPIVDYYVRCV